MLQDARFESASGEPASGVLCMPEGDDEAPALIICHEWWGLNDDIRATAGRFAAEGFIALAVDLYAGRVTSDESEALTLANELRTLDGMQVIRGAVGLLRGLPRSNQRVGITGFCLGGAMSLAAACNVPELGASVPFYGLPRAEHADWSKARMPIQGHFAAHDEFVTPARVRAAHEAALAAGASFELHFYDAGHAFMRQRDAKAHHPESAALAWSRAIQFLRTHLTPTQ